MGEASKKLREEAQDEDIQIQMTPMIDIVFQLLIFFMLACRFRTEEGEIQSMLPKNRGPNEKGTPEDTLFKVRVKLLWVEPESLRETQNPVIGRTLLKVKERVFPFMTNQYGETCPDWNKFYELVCTARDNYIPSQKYPTLPVIVDARKNVPFKHVIAAVNECVRAGIKDVTFAAPEIKY